MSPFRLLCLLLLAAPAACDFGKPSNDDDDDDWEEEGGGVALPPAASTDTASGGGESGGAGSGSPEERDDGEGSSPDSEGFDTALGDDVVDEPASLWNPTISFASAVCVGDMWRLKILASDPQGNNTLSDEANCDIYAVGDTEGVLIDSVSMGCALGDCGKNYADPEEVVSCLTADQWEFHFTISDEDGFVSTPMVVVGSIEE